MHNNYFQNKIVLVTGGGSGIGRGLCLKLSAAGATVICTDIDTDKAAETVSLSGQDNVTALKLDVSQLAYVENTIAGIVARYGRLDLIFNNAGIAVSGEMRDLSMDDWKKIIDINFYGVLYGSQTAYRYMLKQGAGQIVNIASAAGLVDYLALMAPYSVTKHAVVNYTKILRLEAKTLGVKVSVVCPGFISTSIGKNAMLVNSNQSWHDNVQNIAAKGISVDKAISHILKGVAANKEVIMFPFQTKAVYFFTRLFKGLFKMIIHKTLKNYRGDYRVG